LAAFSLYLYGVRASIDVRVLATEDEGDDQMARYLHVLYLGAHCTCTW
jgi:hypothetical protein